MIYFDAAVAVLIFFHIGFLISLKLRRNDIADVFLGSWLYRGRRNCRYRALF